MRAISAAFASAALAAMAPAAWSGNPLGLREYVQTVEIEFSSPEDAASAKLSASPLPFNKKLAVSARWDDTNPAHLKTHEIMAANGIKGSFYLCAGNPSCAADYCKKLLEGGCSIGAHSKSHPFLPKENPNEQFYEIMSVRAEREADADASVTTMAFPYNQWADSLDKEAQSDIGKAMRTSGFIAVPTAYGLGFGLEKILGYPAGTLAESLLVVPGDRDVSMEKADKDFAQGVNAPEKMAANPCLTVGIHSWHTPDGLKGLDAVLKKYAGRPEWWYCNQNEYGAYRYEANNCQIEKSVEGSKAVFKISRVCPSELGASVPLWLKVEGAKAAPLKASGNASLKSEDGADFVEAPHAKEELLPTLVASIDGKEEVKGEKPAKMPFLAASFKAEAASGKLQLELENSGAESLKDVHCIFRAAPGWDKEIVRIDVPEIAAGAKRSVEAELGARSQALRYKLGRPYFIAQADFMKGAELCRLYVSTRQPAPEIGSECPLHSLRAYAPIIEETGFAKLSEASSDLAALNMKPLSLNPQRSSPWGIQFSFPREKLPKEPFKSAAVFEFEAPSGQAISFESAGAEVYLNGAKLDGKGAKRSFEAAPGKNRLIAVYSNKDQRLNEQVAIWTGALKFLKAE